MMPGRTPTWPNWVFYLPGLSFFVAAGVEVAR